MLTMLAIIYIFCLTCLVSAKFPKDINRCKLGDNACIVAESNRVLHTFVEGHPGLNLVKLDPFHIEQITIKQGSESPVNIELTFKDIKLLGVGDLNFYQIKGFENNHLGQYEIRLKGPVLYMIGPYKISGRVLILPIQGEGQCNMTLVSPDLFIRYTGNKVIRNEKEYLQTDDFKLTFDIDRLFMHFDNLYRGDKVLGDSTNLFLNENWEQIFNELKRSIYEAFGLVMGNIINEVFHKIPFNELFLQ